MTFFKHTSGICHAKIRLILIFSACLYILNTNFLRTLLSIRSCRQCFKFLRPDTPIPVRKPAETFLVLLCIYWIIQCFPLSILIITADKTFQIKYAVTVCLYCKTQLFWIVRFSLSCKIAFVKIGCTKRFCFYLVLFCPFPLHKLIFINNSCSGSNPCQQYAQCQKPDCAFLFFDRKNITITKCIMQTI